MEKHRVFPWFSRFSMENPWQNLLFSPGDFASTVGAPATRHGRGAAAAAVDDLGRRRGSAAGAEVAGGLGKRWMAIGNP